MTLFGIDVSKWQGEIAWGKVGAFRGPAGERVSFAICRASIGTAPDGTFLRNIAGARVSGIIPGAYHWLTPNAKASAGQQAGVFIQQIRKAGFAPGMLLVVDIEERGVTHADAIEFISRVQVAFPAAKVIAYGGEYGVLDDDVKQVPGPTWLAWYPGVKGSTPKAAYESVGGDAAKQWSVELAGHKPVLWQFTSTGVPLPGIGSIGLDWDAFRGTLDELKALAGIPVPPPPAPPKPTPKPPVPAPKPPVKPAPKPHRYAIYVVKAGDTLYGIARAHGITVAQLLRIPGNRRYAANPALIHPGSRVVVPVKK